MTEDYFLIPDFGLDWLDAGGPEADIVLSTRVRLARNLQGHRYVCRASAGDREIVFRTVARAVNRGALPPDTALVRMNELGRRTQQILLERRLVSSELIGQAAPDSGVGVAVSSGNAVSVMINEEDHLRLQCLMSGLRLMEGWNRVDKLDEELGGLLQLAYHHEFGFLTSCPTNVGTGLRASALLHLPGLVLTKEIERALRGITQVGLTTRGLYGEGSEFVGNFFQISNQTTLGQGEEDLLDHLNRVVGTVITKEREARQVLTRDAGAITEDKIWRAYGLLRYARALDYVELMNLLSGVRLGVSLKLLPSPPVYWLNRIMIFSQAAHLAEAAGRTLSTEERRAHRAQYVRQALRGESGSTTTDPGV